MLTWRLVVDIFEPGTGYDYPVVRHVFSGKTRDEAAGYFNAHMGTDSFMRACVNRARWRDVECDTEARWFAPGEPVGEV